MADATYQPKVYRRQGGEEFVVASGGKLTPESGAIIQAPIVLQVRVRATAAEVNGAGGKEILPAVPGYKYRIVDAAMIAIGGAAATATSVDLVTTLSAGASRPLVIAVAALSENTLVRMGATNAVILAAGASFTARDANTNISVQKQSGGSNLATATHIDVLLSYVIEA